MTTRLNTERKLLNKQEDIADKQFIIEEKNRVLFLEQLKAEGNQVMTGWDTSDKLDALRD